MEEVSNMFKKSVEQSIDISQNLISQGENILDKLLSNEYVLTSLKVFLALYAAMAAPRLPSEVLNLFSNPLVKIAWAAVIVILATKKPDLALIVAVAFVVTLETLNKQNLYKTLHSSNAPKQISWLPSTKSTPQVIQQIN